MKNQRYFLVCKEHGTHLVDNESYDFRINMYKSEAPSIWVFVDDDVDLSGMYCSPNCDGQRWEAVPTKIHS